MSDIHNKKAAEIIKKFVIISLATCNKDSQPWNSPLSCVYNKDLVFYTNSDKDTVHAVNIKENPPVFFVIFDSTLPNNAGNLSGVYFQGKSYEVNDKDEIMTYRKIVFSKKGIEPSEEEHLKFSGNSNRRVYKFIPEKIWINDVELDNQGKYVKDIRVEVPINELKKLI